MIAVLMANGLVAISLLLLGGFALEIATAGSRLPRRLIWSGAMMLSLVLVGLAGLGAAKTQSGQVVEIVSSGDPAALTPSPAGALTVPGAMRVVGKEVSRVLATPALLASRTEFDDRWLLAVWGACSASLLAIGVGSLVRYRHLRRCWPVALVDGHRVRVSPSSGPAVMGLIRPEVIVPRWLLLSSAEERRLVLAHEHEHLRTRDGALLSTGWLIVALCPWNPALWWMLFRLRLAVEIDCDRRVLAGGVEKHRYGSMLIDLSAHGSGLSLAVPALAGFPSTLERRLVAMTTDSSRRPRGLRALAATLSGVAVLAACESELPTAADIEALDAETVASQARVLGIDSTSFVVDGVAVSAEEAKTLTPGQIASVQVVRGQGTSQAGGTIYIETQDDRPVPEETGVLLSEVRVVGYGSGGARPAVEGTGDPLREFTIVGPRAAGERPESASSASLLPEVTVVGYGAPGGSAASSDGEYIVVAGFARPTPDAAPEPAGIRINAMTDPLYLIDGVAATIAEFNRLAPASIQSISVLKGGSATAQYTDPRARNGVVMITTKSGTP